VSKDHKFDLLQISRTDGWIISTSLSPKLSFFFYWRVDRDTREASVVHTRKVSYPIHRSIDLHYQNVSDREQVSPRGSERALALSIDRSIRINVIHTSVPSTEPLNVTRYHETPLNTLIYISPFS